MQTLVGLAVRDRARYVTGDEADRLQMTKASHLRLLCCSFDCALRPAEQSVCIHAAHAEGAGADSCCIVSVTAACEHASALLQRDARCQARRLAPVLQTQTVTSVLCTFAVVDQVCRLSQGRSTALNCRYVRTPPAVPL